MTGLLGQVGARLAARIVSAAAQAVVLVLTARELGPSQFGDFALTSSFVGLVFVVASLGVPTMVLRLGSDRSHVADADVLWFLALSMAASAVGGVAGAAAVGAQVDSLAWAAAALVVSDQSAEASAALLSGRDRIGAATRLILWRRAIQACLFVALSLALGLVPAIYWVAGAGAVPFLVLVLLSGAPSARRCMGVIQRSLPYCAATWAGQISTLDVPLVRLIAGAQIGGIYAAAARMSLPLQTVPAAILGILVPRLATASVEERRSLERGLARLGYGAAALIATCAPVAGWVVPQVLGSDYADTRILVVAMVLAIALSCLSQVRQAEMLALGRADTAAVAIALGTVVGLGILALGASLWMSAVPIAVILIQVCVLAALAYFGGRIGVRTSDRHD